MVEFDLNVVVDVESSSHAISSSGLISFLDLCLCAHILKLYAWIFD